MRKRNKKVEYEEGGDEKRRREKRKKAREEKGKRERELLESRATYGAAHRRLACLLRDRVSVPLPPSLLFQIPRVLTRPTAKVSSPPGARALLFALNSPVSLLDFASPRLASAAEKVQRCAFRENANESEVGDLVV